MPLSKVISTYDDCHKVLQAAIANEGVLYTLPNPGKAKHFRMRCHYYRTLLHARMEKVSKAVETSTPFDNITITQMPENPSCLSFTIHRGLEGNLTSSSGESVPLPTDTPEDLLTSDPNLVQELRTDIELEAERIANEIFGEK